MSIQPRILENLDVEKIEIDEGGVKSKVPMVVYNAAAQDELEVFLLSWRRQYKKIYWPAPARAAEFMLFPILAAYIKGVKTRTNAAMRIDQSTDALARFLCLGNPSVSDFLALDDRCISDLVTEVSTCENSPSLQNLAQGLLTNDLYSSIGLAASFKTPKLRREYREYIAEAAEGHNLELDSDVFFDESKPRDVGIVPEPPFSAAALANIIFVRGPSGKPQPIQQLSHKLRNKPPLQVFFVHTATAEIHHQVLSWTKTYCRKKGVSAPNRRATRSNTVRAAKYYGMQ